MGPKYEPNTSTMPPVHGRIYPGNTANLCAKELLRGRWAKPGAGDQLRLWRQPFFLEEIRGGCVVFLGNQAGRANLFYRSVQLHPLGLHRGEMVHFRCTYGCTM